MGNSPARAAMLSEMLLALDFHLDKPKEIVIVTPKDQPRAADPFLTVFRKQHLPNRTFTVVEEGKALKTHDHFIPNAEGKIALNGQGTAYVCEKGICELPATNPETFAKQLATVVPFADTGH